MATFQAPRTCPAGAISTHAAQSPRRSAARPFRRSAKCAPATAPPATLRPLSPFGWHNIFSRRHRNRSRRSCPVRCRRSEKAAATCGRQNGTSRGVGQPPTSATSTALKGGVGFNFNVPENAGGRFYATVPFKRLPASGRNRKTRTCGRLTPGRTRASEPRSAVP
jgi:hypothetical protein